MKAIENAAFVTVGKACGFAWLAIFCTTFGFMYEPPLAALVGAVMSLSLALILKACGAYSLRKPYKRTEMWLYIREEDRPPEAYAQRIISNTLHDTYQWFAKQASVFGAIFLIAWIGLQAMGVRELPSQTRVHNVIGHKPPVIQPLPDDRWASEAPHGRAWQERVVP